MLSEPLTITYDGDPYDLPRVSANSQRTIYRSSDGMFEVQISEIPDGPNGSTVGFKLSRISPDETPSDVFDPFRQIRNSVELRFGYDVSRYEVSTVLGLLRTALLAYVDTSLQARLVGGEK